MMNQTKRLAERAVFLKEKITSAEAEKIKNTKYAPILEFVKPQSTFDDHVDTVLGSKKKKSSTQNSYVSSTKQIYINLMDAIEEHFGLDVMRLNHNSIQGMTNQYDKLVQFTLHHIGSLPIDGQKKREIIERLTRHKDIFNFLHEILVQITHFV